MSLDFALDLYSFCIVQLTRWRFLAPGLFFHSVPNSGCVECEIAIEHSAILTDTLSPGVQEIFTFGTQLVGAPGRAVSTRVPAGDNQAIALHLAQRAIDGCRVGRANA